MAIHVIELTFSYLLFNYLKNSEIIINKYGLQLIFVPFDECFKIGAIVFILHLESTHNQIPGFDTAHILPKLFLVRWNIIRRYLPMCKKSQDSGLGENKN